MLPLVPSARLTTAALVCLFCASYSYADDWPQWLGPNRDGVWKEEGLLETFPKDGPKVLWKKPINPGYSGQVFQEVNSYRRSHGGMDLERHAGLDRLAQEHCQYLMQHRGTFSLNGKNVSHIGFEDRTLVARERYRMASVSENVVAASHLGKNPAPTLVKLWAGSKGHEYNMRGAWTHTGIGIVTDSDGMVFCTQLFSTVNYSQLAMRDRFSGF